MNLHIHLWRKRLRPGEVQFGESLLRYCRCGMVRLGRLRWHEVGYIRIEVPSGG